MTNEELVEHIRTLRSFETDHQHVEAKRAKSELPKRLWETISAFSNTPGGGVLILGLNEEKGFEASGVKDAGKISADLASVCDEMVPPVRALIKPHEFEGSNLVVAEIPEVPIDQRPCHYKGAGLTHGAFIRVGDGDRRLTSYEVQLMRSLGTQPQHDREVVPGSTMGDLNEALTAVFLERIRQNRASMAARSDAEVLKLFGVTASPGGEGELSLAGLLALGEAPQVTFPELSLIFVAYPSTRPGEPGPRGERFLDEARLEGPIPSMVDQALKVMQRNMTRRAVVQGLGRSNEWEYPLTALREAVVNALVHRDLSPMARGTPVQVQMYPDRLEVVNPGGLHGPVTVDSLGDTGISSSRNATLMRILEETPVPGSNHLVCENRGSGIAAMISALRTAGMSPPEFSDRISAFSVSFPNHTMWDDATLAWLRQIGAEGLRDSQQAGLALLRSGVALSNEIYRRYNNVDSRQATRELRELVSLGLVEPVGSGRWTTYRRPGQDGPSEPELDLGLDESGSLDDRILAALEVHGELSRAALAELVGDADRAVRYRLRHLVREGLVETTQESPRSPKQTYRLAT